MKWLSYLLVCGLIFVPGVASAVQLTNPLGETNPQILIARLIQAGLSISGSIALLMFVYGGFLWMTSMGNSNQVEKGKQILLWATLGVVLIASAFTVVTAIFTGLDTGNVTLGSSALLNTLINFNSLS